MNKITKITLSVLMLMRVFSTALTLKEAKEVESVSATQHMGNFDPYTYSGNYYNSITSKAEGMDGQLRKDLSSLILPDDWTSYSDGLAEHLPQSDEDPTNSSNMILFYTRDSIKKNAASNWNREHTWPKSLSGNNWGTGKAGTDLLHLRPTYNDTNSTRSSIPFGYAGDSAETLYSKTGNLEYAKKGNGYFEPLDATKGDVARIIMYTWVAYKDYYSNMPDITRVFESYDTLLEWHTMDKPDVLEGHRNDYVEASLQKNRNPFVDHPEYAWMIFGQQASTSVLNACKEAYPGTSATLTGVTFDSEPEKTTYFINENIDTSGMKLTATYSDGSQRDVTSNATLSITNVGSTIGNKTVNVSCLGYNFSFIITVKDYEPVALSEVRITESETEIEINKTYQISAKAYPLDAYPIPTISYSSDNSTVATVSNSGLVSVKAEGEATITVSATQGSVVKTATLNVVVTPKQLEKLADAYDKAIGDSVEFYCVYTGAYATAKQGIFVADGNYGITIYGYEGNISSYVPYETFLKVTGTLDIFNHLYEVKTATLTVMDPELVKSYIKPITTYQITGQETEVEDEKDLDLSIYSRPSLIEGTVTKITGDFSPTKDTTVTVKLDDEHTSTIFVKKNAGLDYNELQNKLVVNEYVRVKGFISIYGMNAQLILPTVVEESDTYLAEDFAQDLLDLTSPICSNLNYGKNRDALVSVWRNLELDKYITLKDSQREILRNADIDEDGTVVERCAARYDYIVGRYELNNFLNRHIEYVSNANLVETNPVEIGTLLIIIIPISVSTLVITSLIIVVIKRRRYLTK